MAERTSKPPKGPPAILNLPNEIVDQIVRELPDNYLGNLRATAKCLHSVTLGAWNKRAMQDKDGHPALEWAAEHNKLSLVEYILGTFPDMEINISQGTRRTNPLCIACGLGLNQVAMALIRHGADVNYDPGWRKALVEAVRGNHHTTVQMLLENGADPHVLDFGNSNIVQVAAGRNHVLTLGVILDWMKAYPESMPGINAFDETGFTALHMASASGALGAATLLLESGADIDPACERSGFETPLARAARVLSHGRAEMATVLLSWGANIEGRTAGSVNITNFDTPLHIAIQRQWRFSNDLASLLIARGAALNTLDGSGLPTLHSAVITRDLDVVSLIVDRGGDVNMVDGGGSSALHLLADLSEREFTSRAVHFFQQRGADMFLVNNAGESARDRALRSGWSPRMIEAAWGGGV